MASDEQTPEDSSDDQGNPVIREVKGLGRRAGSWRQSAGQRLNRAARSDRTARAVSDLEERIAAFRRERKIGKGTLRDTHVAAYRGFISAGQASIRIRVLEEPVVPDSAEILTDPKIIRTNLRRFVALAFPGVKLRIMFGEGGADVVSDRHGYANAHIPTSGLTPGWHDYHVVTIPENADERPHIATGEVLLPDPKAPFAVVSDVDDTVLKTGLTEGFVAVRQTLLGSAATRRAIPGMAALYQGLSAGTGTKPRPAFYYLSTGPWNLYEMLTDFFDLRGFPKGVLLLTDWGPQERYVMRSGKEHKRLSLNRLFAAYPRTKFVFIGDSGQNDPYVYVEAAREQPHQVRAIIILDVGDHMPERAEELRAWQAELQAEQIPFFFVADAAEAAHVMRRHRLISRDVIAKVEADIAADSESV